MITKQKGFTLIELLVVIAIIGILSSVVLAALSNGRNKANNSSVKANLNTIRTRATLIYEIASPNSFNTVCNGTQDTNIANALSTILKSSGATSIDLVFTNAGSATNVTCHSSATAWAVSSPLKMTEGSNTFWCVDNLGNAKGQTAALLASDTICNTP